MSCNRVWMILEAQYNVRKQRGHCKPKGSLSSRETLYGRSFRLQPGTVVAVSRAQQGYLGSHPNKVTEGCKEQPDPAASPWSFLVQSKLG